MTYSFDIFDTCLCRLCGEPRNLFDVLSLKVQQRMGENGSEYMRQHFVATRCDCGGHSLEEIYSEMAGRFPLPCSVEEMVQLELDTEREMLVPIVATRRLVDDLRKKGNIMFISDMYLPDGFIREQLIRHGFFHEGDRLYVSDSVGAWKHDGSLFRLVHEREGIPYRQWHHYGDNYHCDYRAARRLGIRAHHLHYDYLPYERHWKEIPSVRYQYPSVLAGVSRAIRLDSIAPDDQKAFVCDISAPLMISWVFLIMQDAQEKGIRRLYFCARDMHSHYRIARRMGQMFPGVEPRYLFISGPALYESNLCLDYLRSAGICDDVPVAIVDSCSSGKTLRVMNEKLASNGTRPVQGYFWARMNILGEPISDARYELDDNYLAAMTRGKVNRLMGMRIFYELLFSLNHHKKTYGYEYHQSRIRPVFADDGDDTYHFDNIEKLGLLNKSNNRLLEAFAEGFIATGLSSLCHDVFHHIALPTLIEFVDRPRKDYLDYLHHFIWCGKPFVGHLHGKGKGVWKRGNIFYTLPEFLASPLRHILASPELRRKLNQLLHKA